MAENHRPLTISTVPAGSLTVGRFLHAAFEPLGLETLAGETGLGRVILEPVLHRPGLALTGFYDYFAWRQMQLFGRSELAYLRTLEADCRRARWEELLRRDVPCVILCAADKESLDGDLLALADRMGVPVLATRQKSFAVFRSGSLILHELTSPRATVHGTLVDVRGVGVLLEGPPGIGKSETALGLVRHGCALIADDITRLWVDAHGALWASPAFGSMPTVRCGELRRTTCAASWKSVGWVFCISPPSSASPPSARKAGSTSLSPCAVAVRRTTSTGWGLTSRPAKCWAIPSNAS